jgi:hypothetical protein
LVPFEFTLKILTQLSFSILIPFFFFYQFHLILLLFLWFWWNFGGQVAVHSESASGISNGLSLPGAHGICFTDVLGSQLAAFIFTLVVLLWN